MADKTAIEWSDATWNPTTGCDRVSPGCANCYALDLAARLIRDHMGGGWSFAPDAEVRCLRRWDGSVPT